MTTYVGGIRDRLIHDSLYHYIKDGLTALGWFDSNPTGFTNPITMIPEQVPWDEELKLNTITISPGDAVDAEFELGVDAMQNKKRFYIDVYGEEEALSVHLSGDIKDLLRGKFSNVPSTITRTGFFSQPTLDVWDWTQATPSFVFFCDVENVLVDRAQNFPHLWQRYLYCVSCFVVDYYGDQRDPFAYGTTP